MELFFYFFTKHVFSNDCFGYHKNIFTNHNLTYIHYLMDTLYLLLWKHTGSFVTWLSLAAVANLFSIFEVRVHLLRNRSLQVMLSLSRLLTTTEVYQHGSGEL